MILHMTAIILRGPRGKNERWAHTELQFLSSYRMLYTGYSITNNTYSIQSQRQFKLGYDAAAPVVAGGNIM